MAVLSKMARLLLIDVAHQFNGSNNGNLSMAPKTLAPYGWRSRGTLDKAIVELVAKGFLMQTRQGGRNRCSLFAMTWHGIDPGPHEAQTDPVPSRLWLSDREHLRDPIFVRRWQQVKTRATEEKKASRVADKASRVADKSAKKKAA
ncbi:hypothetical protein CKO25_02730 [Thiocapsa imhoffii]|uniref:Helix-turn-helix domain-containing protein n=1 Tax=Thiocapsa imhoffii TaxID=382777 RepID=A0A9X0WF71_9GAMM|nr:hypothetical protein [Thiocapsa imhoffii]